MDANSNPIDFGCFALFQHKPAATRQVIESFIHSALDYLDKIDTGIKNQDAKTTKDVLHALAGSAFHVGATQLAEHAQRLFEAKGESTLPTAEDLDRLIQDYQRARTLLQCFIDDLPKQDTLHDAKPTSPKIILLIEDNVDSRLAVRLALEDHYHILEAATGQDALKILEQERIDLAIIDLNLGHAQDHSPSGFSLLSRLKNDPPAIVYTVDQRVTSIRKAVATGARGYVTKSSGLLNLYAAVEVALADSAARSSRKPKTLAVATGWLMATYQITQDLAQALLEKIATEQRAQQIDIAHEIIDRHQFDIDLRTYIASSTTPSLVKKD